MGWEGQGEISKWRRDKNKRGKQQGRKGGRRGKIREVEKE